MKPDLMFTFLKLFKHLDYTIRKIIRRNKTNADTMSLTFGEIINVEIHIEEYFFHVLQL